MIERLQYIRFFSNKMSFVHTTSKAVERCIDSPQDLDDPRASLSPRTSPSIHASKACSDLSTYLTMDDCDEIGGHNDLKDE